MKKKIIGIIFLSLQLEAMNPSISDAQAGYNLAQNILTRFNISFFNDAFSESDQSEVEDVMNQMIETLVDQKINESNYFPKDNPRLLKKRKFELSEPLEHKCAICNKILSTERKLKSHVKQQHQRRITKANDSVIYQEIFTCPRCTKKCMSFDRLNKHFDTSHWHQIWSSFECSHCNIVFKTLLGLRNHITKRHRPKNFFCNECALEYSTKISLMDHIIKKHSQYSFESKKPAN